MAKDFIPGSTLWSQLVSRAYFLPLPLFYIGPAVRSQNQIPLPREVSSVCFSFKSQVLEFQVDFRWFLRGLALPPTEILTAEVKLDEVLIASDSHCVKKVKYFCFIFLYPSSLQEREKAPRSLVWNKNMHHTRFLWGLNNLGQSILKAAKSSTDKIYRSIGWRPT